MQAREKTRLVEKNSTCADWLDTSDLSTVLSHDQVTTVDRYQGQQNDYIILSLVRTRTVGHIRDVRRLVVAMSRARLGLYVLARVNLFRNCFELRPAFSQVRKPA